MPSKTFHLDGNAGVLMIGNYGINLDAVNNPNNYLAQLNFHSNLNYLQIKGYIAQSYVYFPGLTRDVVYWDDGSKCDLGCYITTACIEYKGLEDDCYILRRLRYFRDTYMMSTERGARLVELYYQTAPDLIRQINKLPNKSSIYEIIYSNYLLRAVTLINTGSLDEAETLYTDLYNFVKSLGE